MKICLGVPNGGRVNARLLSQLISNVFVSRAEWVLADCESSFAPDAQWRAGHAAINANADYLWLVDNDMSLAPDALPRLLAHGKAIVGAAYNHRYVVEGKRRTTVRLRDANGRRYIPDTLPPALFEVEGIGAGCLLIQVDALRQIPQPWFKLEWNETTGEMINTNDYWFCKQARNAGIPVFCDPTIHAGHIGDFEF